jgi:hypothetical protein
MSVGRNDPCPCGSGKKYKKCCLVKDEAAARPKPAIALVVTEAVEAQPSLPPYLLKPPDPRLEAWNARWEEFDQSDYEQQIALFLRTLDEPELMDGEMAFEMLNPLYSQMVERGERERYDQLLAALRERYPEIYEKEKEYLLYT